LLVLTFAAPLSATWTAQTWRGRAERRGQRRRFKKQSAWGRLYETGAARRGRKPWPPTMTSVHTTTRKGIGVSPSPPPRATMVSAARAPIPSGSS